MKLLSIQVGLPRTVGQPEAKDLMNREWTSAIFKERVEGPVAVRTLGLEGDGQADLEVHGGPDKAINAYCAAHYPYWMEQLKLRDMAHGAFGENFTLADTQEGGVCIGDILEAGTALLQVSQPRQPCWKLARRWHVKDLAARVQKAGKTGWYYRVLREGSVEAGQELTLLERPQPDWTIEAANEVMYQRKDDKDAARALAECPELAESWREALTSRFREI